MKTFEYCRKSTKDKEDQQVLSLDGQHEECEKTANRLGHKIVDSFEEKMSAKKPGRVKLNDMLTRIEHGEAEAIICWRLNRLARNPIDGGRIQWLLQQGVIKAIITPEKTYLPTDNVIQMSVEFGMATQFSIDLGKDVKRGMLQKAKMGWRPVTAPIGYLNDYGGVKGEKEIFRDPERFDLARRCWDHLLSGAYTVKEIHCLARDEWGMTVTKGRRKIITPIALQSLYNMFHNPFYCGEFDWGGQHWSGAHVPMITKAEYDHAQEILGSRGRPRAQTHENPYPCLIHCGDCGSSIVMEVKKKFVKRENMLKTFTYFRCGKSRVHHPCNQRHCVRQIDLDPQVLNVVETAELPQAFIDWALQKLKLTQEDKKKQREAELRRLQEQHGKAEQRVDALIDLRLENPSLFPEEAFKRKIAGLESEVKRCEVQLTEHGKAAKTWREEFIDKLLFVEKAKERFLNDTPKERIGMLCELKESLELTDGKLIPRYQEPFRTFLLGKKRMEKRLGSLEPLNCHLEQVKTSVLEKVIPVWSRFGDLNPGPTHYK